MANEGGRWVTVHGAHVFIKDGEQPKFNGTLQKTAKHEEEIDFEAQTLQKVKKMRDFIEETVKEINDFKYDPANGDYGMSNSDLQSMVESFVARNGMDSDDEERMLNEIRIRTSMSGSDEERKEYEKASEINRNYWKGKTLQKYNAHPMK